MKKGAIIVVILGVIIAVLLGVLILAPAPREGPEPILPPPSSNMKLTSPAFEHNGMIPKKYTCDGEDINPELRIEGVPENAKSLALTMDDPDVPKSIRPDGMWDHWVAWNIPPETRKLEEGQTPPGVVGRNTRGDNAYGGPCPPDREHRYFFKLYALDTTLALKPDAAKRDLESAMQNHIITHTELIGRYAR